MDNIKVLMVDDESRMRKLVSDFLTRKGYIVIEAGDGEEALDRFYADKDISLVILDVMMPKMNGWDVCREIRKNSKVPIIMLTAKSDGFECGADEYIAKPFSPKILTARVDALIRRSYSIDSSEVTDVGGIIIDKAAHIVKIDGQEKYIMLVGTWAARDLKADPVWQAAQQNAAIRGSKNPIFTGALGEYDGVVLYEYERIMNTKTGASSANVVHNLLLGQQAACFAVAREARFIKDEDDYGNVQGNGIAFFGGIVKSIYNSKDYVVIQVMTGGAVE